MSQYTENYHLEKPESNDNFENFITNYGSNMDIIDEHLGGGGDTVTWNQIQSSGAKIAEISINGTQQDVYAPEGGGSTVEIVPNPVDAPTAQLNSLGFYSDDAVTILDNGVVSTNSAYAWASYITTLTIGETYDLKLTDSFDSSHPIYSSFTWQGSTIILTLGDRKQLTIESARAGLTYFPGAWRYHYLDIKSRSHSTVYKVGNVSDNPTFTEAQTRANIASGESFATILGKIKKFFTDLKTVAFTGSYNDLSDKPTIPDISTKVSKSGDTMSGNLTIDRQNGTTSTEGESALLLGNNIAVGTDKNSSGAIYLWKGNKYVVIRPDTLDGNKSISIPNNSGTLVLENTIFPNDTWRDVGDDVRIGDKNTGGTLHIQGKNATTAVRFHKYGDDSNVADLTYDGTQFALTKNLKVTGMMTVERSDNDTVLYLKGNNANKTHIRFTASDDSVIGYLGIDKSSGTPKANVYYDGSNHYLALEKNVIPYKTDGGLGAVGGNGTVAYAFICEIKITNTYANRPIYLEVSGRNLPFTTINIRFKNVNNTDPALDIFTVNTELVTNFRLFKTATSTWQLYYYIGSWNDITLHRISGKESSYCTPKMTWTSTLPASWDSGTVPTNDLIAGTVVANDSIQLPYDSNYRVTLYSATLTASRSIFFPNKGGTVAMTSDISSRRYKENIIPLSEDEAKKILDVEIVNYDYKENVVDEDERYDQKGAIAEDVVNLIPNAVTYADIDGEQLPDGINYTKFIPYLIKMVQMQQKEIEELKAMIKEK